MNCISIGTSKAIVATVRQDSRPVLLLVELRQQAKTIRLRQDLLAGQGETPKSAVRFWDQMETVKRYEDQMGLNS